jgi:chorismate mutase
MPRGLRGSFSAPLRTDFHCGEYLGPEELEVTGSAENCIRRIIHVLGQTSLKLSKLRIFRW